MTTQPELTCGAPCPTHPGTVRTEPPRVRVEIDPNVRTRGTPARVGFEDADSPLQPGQHVEVYESESGLTGAGTVTAINPTDRLAWIAVDWGQLRPAIPCSGAVLHQPHSPHQWAHHPGVEAVRCDGFEATPPASPTLKAPQSGDDLRRRITRAIHRYDYEHDLSRNGVPSRHHRGEADAVLAELAPELAELADYRNRRQED